MKLPETVLVGWKTFKVEDWDPKLAASSRRYGECDHTPAIIRIDTSHSPEQVLETLLHELYHAAIEVGGLVAGPGPQWDEERVVTYFASWQSTLLKQNPTLAKLIWQVYGAAEGETK